MCFITKCVYYKQSVINKNRLHVYKADKQKKNLFWCKTDAFEYLKDWIKNNDPCYFSS